MKSLLIKKIINYIENEINNLILTLLIYYENKKNIISVKSRKKIC